MLYDQYRKFGWNPVVRTSIMIISFPKLRKSEQRRFNQKMIVLPEKHG
jgi:hypothetical protein